MDHSSIVVITGANSGRGKAIAIELAKTGAVIVMVWRSKERGEVALQDVRNLSGNKIMQVLSCLDIIKQPMDMNFILACLCTIKASQCLIYI